MFSVEHELYIFAVGSRSPFLSSHVWSAMTSKVAACQMLNFVLHLWIWLHDFYGRSSLDAGLHGVDVLMGILVGPAPLRSA